DANETNFESAQTLVDTTVRDVVIVDGGKAVMLTDTRRGIELWRYNADGSLDRSFGMDGRSVAAIPAEWDPQKQAHFESFPEQIEALADGRLLVLCSYLHWGELFNGYFLGLFSADGKP